MKEIKFVFNENNDINENDKVKILSDDTFSAADLLKTAEAATFAFIEMMKEKGYEQKQSILYLANQYAKILNRSQSIDKEDDFSITITK